MEGGCFERLLNAAASSTEDSRKRIQREYEVKKESAEKKRETYTLKVRNGIETCFEIVDILDKKADAKTIFFDHFLGFANMDMIQNLFKQIKTIRKSFSHSLSIDFKKSIVNSQKMKLMVFLAEVIKPVQEYVQFLSLEGVYLGKLGFDHHSAFDKFVSLFTHLTRFHLKNLMCKNLAEAINMFTNPIYAKKIEYLSFRFRALDCLSTFLLFTDKFDDYFEEESRKFNRDTIFFNNDTLGEIDLTIELFQNPTVLFMHADNYDLYISFLKKLLSDIMTSKNLYKLNIKYVADMFASSMSYDLLHLNMIDLGINYLPSFMANIENMKNLRELCLNGIVYGTKFFDEFIMSISLLVHLEYLGLFIIPGQSNVVRENTNGINLILKYSPKNRESLKTFFSDVPKKLKTLDLNIHYFDQDLFLSLIDGIKDHTDLTELILVNKQGQICVQAAALYQNSYPPEEDVFWEKFLDFIEKTNVVNLDLKGNLGIRHIPQKYSNFVEMFARKSFTSFPTVYFVNRGLNTEIGKILSRNRFNADLKNLSLFHSLAKNLKII